MKRIQTLWLLLTLLPAPGWSQDSYSVSEHSKVLVKGTSTLHDWESRVEEVTGQGEFMITGDKVTNVSSFSLKFRAKSLKSGKERMDKLTWAALKADDNPDITFTLTELLSAQGSQLKARGQLDIAGSNQEVTIVATANVKDTDILIKGQHALLMTDYGVDPPTAVLGTIKTDDEVIIDFELTLTK